MLNENLDVFFQAPFGQAAVLTVGTAAPVEVWGVLDEAFMPVLEPGVATEGRRITFATQTTAVSGVSHGDGLQIEDRSFEVVGIEPISDGKVTDLVLKDVA